MIKLRIFLLQFRSASKYYSEFSIPYFRNGSRLIFICLLSKASNLRLLFYNDKTVFERNSTLSPKLSQFVYIRNFI